MAALSVQKLQKSFGGLRVTDAVDLTVEPGERRLIIGPNGAGKTTLFNLITGELSPDAGSITLFGRDITRVPSHRRPHLGMALAQNPRVLLLDEPFAGLSLEERRDVLALVSGIPRDVTIVMIEHDMDVALDFAERITVLHFGQVVVEGTRGEVVAHPRTREIYLVGRRARAPGPPRLSEPHRARESRGGRTPAAR